MEDNTNSRVGSASANRQHTNDKRYNALFYDELPYEDPAIVNPAELATYPRPAEKMDAEDVENENEIRMVNPNRNPVREGRNIISTDNNPERDGFM